MRRTPVSDPDLAAEGAFKGEIDRNSNFRQQAFDHDFGRNVQVLKLLTYVARLRGSVAAMMGAIECTAAERQNFSSRRSMTHMGLPTGTMQAAHFMPGQLRIGGRNVWQFAANPMMASRIECLFAEVEHLPVVFNQADSAAEESGLCSGLENAVTAVIRPLNGTSSGGSTVMADVQRGFDIWRRDALAGFERAIAAKRAKPGLPPLVGNRFDGYTLESVKARSEAGKTEFRREECVRILGYYLEDQRQLTWESVTNNCQWVFREVESNFRV